MSEVSNRTLAALLVAAIVVSLGGTFVSLNKLGEAGGGTLTLTGRAESGSGTINLSVISVLAIVMNDSTIDFGSGQPDGGVDNFACDSSNVTHAGAVNWSGNGLGCTDVDAITIENSGTVVGNVTVQSDANATDYICGNDAGPDTCAAAGSAVQSFQYKIGLANSGNCDGEPNTFAEFDKTAQEACWRLGATEQFDLYSLFVAPSDFDGSALATLNFTVIDALTDACTADGGCS